MLGIVAPVVLFIFFVILGLAQQGYNPIYNYISELASVNAPFKFLVDVVGFIGTGVIMIGFCFTLEHWLGKTRNTVIAQRLFLGGSLMIILLGFFPTDIRGVAITLDGTLHTIFGAVAFLMLPISIIWYGVAFHKDDEWEKLWRIISFCLGIIALVSAGIIEFAENFFYNGFIERIGIGAVFLWIFFVSVNLFLKEQLA